MRYTTFRNLALATGAIVVGGAGYMCGSSRSPPVRMEQPAPAASAAPPATAPVAPAAPRTAVPVDSQRDDDLKAALLGALLQRAAVPVDSHRNYLLGLLGRPASGDKIKDGLRGPVKVNVYAEKGVWGRAKVDLDRDEKWDEKWSLEGTAIMRQSAPLDDERYGDKVQEGTTAGP